MKQIKPEVIGYQRIKCNNKDYIPLFLWRKDEMKKISQSDFDEYEVKSKFRPVYKKD